VDEPDASAGPAPFRRSHLFASLFDSGADYAWDTVSLGASEATAGMRLSSLYDAGLRVLAISRHHFDAEQRQRLNAVCTRRWKD